MMKVFVAGASGAIGTPLVTELISNGHEVTGMTRSRELASKLSTLGVKAVIVDAFDATAVAEALRSAQPEVVIDELTSLPKDPADYGSAFEGDRKLRLEGGTILYQAAITNGVRRYIQQSSGYFLKVSHGLADETAGLALDASAGIAGAVVVYAKVEERVAASDKIEGVALRYGIFYGPNTWYSPEGAAADHARRQELPIIGEGNGVWSFVHIQDAAIATAAALTSPAGIYNVVDDDPSAVRDWLPAFALSVGAPPPPRISVDDARTVAGEDAIYYGTKLQGASNAKARRVLNFTPRRLEWLSEISP
jgi:nucleoside-diphosphate-sugar epimerase